MRLGYLVSQYPAVTHTFILREIRTLRSLGFEIDVVSIRAPDRPLEQLSPEEREEAGRTWAVLPRGAAGFLTAHLAALFSRPFRYLGGLWSAVALARLDLRAALFNLAYFAEAVVAGRYLHGRGIGHVHTHFSSNVALLAARVYPITFSATIHGPDEFNNAAGFYLGEKAAEARFLCAISRYAKSQLMRASRPEHWNKIEVSPLGVDPSLFTPRPHRDAPASFEILSVGRLAVAKAQVILIEAIGELVRQGRSVRLRVAGEGPERGALEHTITRLGLEQYVLLEGACSQARVRQLYQETDLFALASFAEGVPVVLMEAMAMEIPCVATWITGVPELIHHGIHGWLVPPSDALELAAAIAQLMDQPELRQHLGQAARLQVQQCYDLRRNTERLAEIYRRRLTSSAS